MGIIIIVRIQYGNWDYKEVKDDKVGQQSYCRDEIVAVFLEMQKKCFVWKLKSQLWIPNGWCDYMEVKNDKV